MFDVNDESAYEKVYEELLDLISDLDLSGLEGINGITLEEGRLVLPLFHRRILVAPDRIEALDSKTCTLAHRIVTGRYVLTIADAGGPAAIPSKDLVPYRELPGGQDFSRYITATIEAELARCFSGRSHELLDRATEIGAGPIDQDLGTDLCLGFVALPTITLALLFNDADDEFPAEARVLYSRDAYKDLDLECLAVLAKILVDELSCGTGGSQG